MNLATLYKLSYGLYIVGGKDSSRINAQIANAVLQVSAEPPTIAVCIHKNNLTHEFIEKGKVFSISILSREAPMTQIGQFGFRSGREINKFEGVEYKIGGTGAPIVLSNTVGSIEAELINQVSVVTHSIFIGKIVEAEIQSEKEPMTYAYYHDIKRGNTPKNAPNYIGGEERKEAQTDKYKCIICGYIYDPEKGDPDSGIKPGTKFEDLPADWVCPICGADKEQFEKV